MVLPMGESALNNEIEFIDEGELPTKTYRLDLQSGQCIGMVDGIEAMEQAIFKMLSTERFRHLIYSDDYGFENPIGREEIFVRAELPRRIEEALLQDGRIIGVENLTMNFHKDAVLVKFTCLTDYGDVEVLREVT